MSAMPVSTNLQLLAKAAAVIDTAAACLSVAQFWASTLCITVIVGDADLAWLILAWLRADASGLV